MPRIVPPLTDSRIKSLQPKAARYSVSDGGGLILEVMPSGSKIWRFRYSLHSRRQPPVTIGAYPDVPLMAARERARRYAEIVASGVSPVADARKDRGQAKRLDTVAEFFPYWFEQQMADKSPAYQRVTKQAMEKDVLPAIGRKLVSGVTPGDVLAICDHIKNRGSPQMALRTRSILKQIFEYAVVRQLAATNPAQAIAARFVATKKSRERVLSPDEIGIVLRAVYTSDLRRSLKLAIHLLMLTMVRKAELIEATWDEFDLDAGIWRIPAERMKKAREHWVYLAPQAVAMLRELWGKRTSQQYLFPSSRGADRPIAPGTLNQATHSLDLAIPHFVLHDFRRTASTHLHERGELSEAIEKALAHTTGGIKGVYNRAEYGEQRAHHGAMGGFCGCPDRRRRGNYHRKIPCNPVI